MTRTSRVGLAALILIAATATATMTLTAQTQAQTAQAQIIQQTATPVTVQPGDSFMVPTDETIMTDSLANSGTVFIQGTLYVNQGTANNEGIIIVAEGGRLIAANNFTNAPDAILRVDIGGSAELTENVVNLGRVENYGSFAGQGMNFTTMQGGTFDNFGTTSNYGASIRVMDANSTINNSGRIFGSFGDTFANIGATVNNNAGATISTGAGFFENSNGGIVNNQGSILIRAQSYQAGVLNNNDANSTILNSGFVGISGTVNNHGNFTNQAGGTVTVGYITNSKFTPTFDNSGVLDNQPGGTIRNLQELVIECGSTFTNNGSYEGNTAVDGCAPATPEPEQQSPPPPPASDGEIPSPP